MEEINYLSLLLATLVPIGVGFIYYQKGLLGKQWASTITIPKEDRIQYHPIVLFIMSFAVCFVMSFFLLQFCNGEGQEEQYDTFAHGAWHGLVLCIFIIIPISITSVLYNERTWKNMLINAGYWLITLPIMGGILGAMNHF